MKSLKYSILIICEGENTEPLFFNSIRDEIKNKTYNVDAFVRILPEPKTTAKADEKVTESIHKKIRKKRELRKSIGEVPEILDGEPPLRWVKTGIRELKDGTYDEVWVVFDHDNHPAREQAFKEADTLVNGKRVNIAYSSRSFEYFLLLNFERIYRKFTKTDCKIDHKQISCGTNENPNDCGGMICLNGYGRSKGYWKDTKIDVSVFPLIKERLIFGFENSAWLRFLSDHIETNVPIYDRNPYVSTDILVKRLTGFEDYHWQYISDSGIIRGLQLVKNSDFSITIKNASKNTIIIPPNAIYRVQIISLIRTYMGERKVLAPLEEYTFVFEKNTDEVNEYFGLKFEREIILFDFLTNNWKIKILIDYLMSLSYKELTELKVDVQNLIDNQN
jgi:hypothetical protein